MNTVLRMGGRQYISPTREQNLREGEVGDAEILAESGAAGFDRGVGHLQRSGVVVPNRGSPAR
ncbi:MAG TPA: hypothetical protein VF921_20185, partial [Vicinamibacterales bacterium]